MQLIDMSRYGNPEGNLCWVAKRLTLRGPGTKLETRWLRPADNLSAIGHGIDAQIVDP
jgi:hypothetical protein